PGHGAPGGGADYAAARGKSRRAAGDGQPTGGQVRAPDELGPLLTVLGVLGAGIFAFVLVRITVARGPEPNGGGKTEDHEIRQSALQAVPASVRRPARLDSRRAALGPDRAGRRRRHPDRSRLARRGRRRDFLDVA